MKKYLVLKDFAYSTGFLCAGTILETADSVEGLITKCLVVELPEEPRSSGAQKEELKPSNPTVDRKRENADEVEARSSGTQNTEPALNLLEPVLPEEAVKKSKRRSRKAIAEAAKVTQDVISGDRKAENKDIDIKTTDLVEETDKLKRGASGKS